MPFTNAGLQAMLDASLSGAIGILYDDTTLVNDTFDDASISGENVTVTGHPFTDYMEVLPTAGSGALPTELQGLGPFWVDVVDANTIRLADSLANRRGDTYVTLTPGGSSTGHTFTEQGISEHSAIEAVVAKEISGNGYARSTTTANSDINNGANDRIEAEVVATFTASGGDIVHSGVAILLGANTTIGDTTGELLVREPAVNTIFDGVTRPYTIRPNMARQPSTLTGTDT